MRPLAARPAAHDEQRRRQRGAVLIWVTFFLLFMLGFIALGVDAAKLMTTRTQLQNAADAAALAGASALDVTTGALVQDTAMVRAAYTTSQNRAFTVGTRSLTLLPGDVSFPTPNSIRVTVRRSPDAGGSMVTHIAQVLGIPSVAVSATAVAKAESANSICEGLVPMAAIEDPGAPFRTGCANTYTLKVGAQGNTRGNFQLLDFPPCAEGPCGDMGGGAAEVRCLVANGYGCCIDLGEWVPTKPGGSVGPSKQGLDDRWSRDTDQREGICHEQYTGNGQRVVLVPVVQTWDVAGKKPVRITGFSAFFLQRKPTGGGNNYTLTGQFLYSVAPGQAGSGPGNGLNTLYSIRLVQ